MTTSGEEVTVSDAEVDSTLDWLEMQDSTGDYDLSYDEYDANVNQTPYDPSTDNYTPPGDTETIAEQSGTWGGGWYKGGGNTEPEIETANDWWGHRVYDSVKSFLGYGDQNSDIATELRVRDELVRYNLEKADNPGISHNERMTALSNAVALRASGEESKASMEDMFKLSQIAFGGLAAYFAYKASRREEEEANKSAEEKGEESAIQTYARSTKLDELYGLDASSGGGGGGATGADIVTYTPGTISGRI
jgi:hypothetical protein